MARVATPTDLRVDIQQIKKNILELATIGRSEADRGIYRMAFSDADMEGKRWLLDRIEEAGLEMDSDGAANIFGKIIPPGPAGERAAILMGSHAPGPSMVRLGWLSRSNAYAPSAPPVWNCSGPSRWSLFPTKKDALAGCSARRPFAG
jgi:hypothetical protein